MKLRTPLDVFSAALLSALGASQIIACGGSAITSNADGGAAGSAGTGTAGSGTAGSGTAGSAGAGTAGSGAGGASAGGTGIGGSSTGGSGNHYPCANPVDLGGGLIQCNGFTHRASNATCPTTVPRATPYPDPGPNAQCKSDADCVDQPYGWCGSGGGFVSGPLCQYGCVKDSDCGANQLCECGNPVGQCVTANCTTDADCGAGFLCKGYDSSGGCNFTTYTCQTAADTCGRDSDCTGPAGNRCGYNGTAKRFECVAGGCAIGRPFLIEGEARVAPTTTRNDWSELALLPRLATVDRMLAAECAREWTRVALMEHASIAAFARFTLQLMSLGAPPELIERATSAMADETKHAKACFAIANAYGATPVGPGALGIEHSLEGTSLEEIVLNTIREGCVGETVAAVEAREAAEYAADPALKQLLLTISEDETQHAELAFRFVKWALTLGDAKLEAAVRRELAALEREATPTAHAMSAPHSELLQHGIVPPALRQVIRARAIQSVITPCAKALFTPSSEALSAPLQHSMTA